MQNLTLADWIQITVIVAILLYAAKGYCQYRRQQRSKSKAESRPTPR